MARETKQDRIVRGIFDQVTEHLHQLKSLESNPNVKEADVEHWGQSFLRNCMGFSAVSGYSIRSQESKGKMRPDLIVLRGDKPVFVVEVKKLGFDLDKSDFRSGKIQLNEYLNLIGDVRWGVLTNGYEWRLFDFSQLGYSGIEIYSFDLRSDDDTIEFGKKLIEEQCYEFLDMHENSFCSDAWEELSREAMAFSPESLAKAILSQEVMKHISRSIRGEHDYKADFEVLTDRVYRLLEQGLNDEIKGWNDTKQAEFHKFIKSQKRASRRVKRARAKTAETALASTASSAPASDLAVAVTTSPDAGDKSKVAS